MLLLLNTCVFLCITVIHLLNRNTMKEKLRKELSAALNWLILLAGLVVVFSMVYCNVATFDPYNEQSFKVYQSIDGIGIRAILAAMTFGGLKIIVAWKD